MFVCVCFVIYKFVSGLILEISNLSVSLIALDKLVS